MCKDPQNTLLGGTPHSPWAATSDGNLQRTSNREHRWEPRQKPSEYSLAHPWFCSHKGHEQLCLALTQHLHQTHTPITKWTPRALAHHLSHQENPFPFLAQVFLPAGIGHCTGHMESGGVQTPEQIIQSPQHSRLFPVRGTGSSLGWPYVLPGRCLLK